MRRSRMGGPGQCHSRSSSVGRQPRATRAASAGRARSARVGLRPPRSPPSGLTGSTSCRRVAAGLPGSPADRRPRPRPHSSVPRGGAKPHPEVARPPPAAARSDLPQDSHRAAPSANACTGRSVSSATLSEVAIRARSVATSRWRGRGTRGIRPRVALDRGTLCDGARWCLVFSPRCRWHIFSGRRPGAMPFLSPYARSGDSVTVLLTMLAVAGSAGAVDPGLLCRCFASRSISFLPVNMSGT